MNAIGASTDVMSADDGARQQGAVSPRCAPGSEPVAGEMQPAMEDIDFSRVNLQYLICARDLVRDYPERAAVLLGAPDDIVQLLADLDAAMLVELRIPHHPPGLVDAVGTTPLVVLSNQWFPLVPYMLDLAAKYLCNRVDLHRGVAEDMPFDDNSFNHAITCRHQK